MHIRKSSIIVAAILLIVGVVSSACAPGGCAPAATTPSLPAETEKPAAPAAEVPEEPPAAAPEAQPAELPAAVEQPTSFEAAEYNNDQYGFSLQYPKSWKNERLIGAMVMRVAAIAGDIQSDAVAAAVVDKPADYGKAIKEAVDETLAASGVPVKTKVESIDTTTLSDGTTPATEAVLSADVYGMYQLYVYALGTDKDGKTIAAMGLTIKGEANKALIREIVRTLAVR